VRGNPALRRPWVVAAPPGAPPLAASRPHPPRAVAPGASTPGMPFPRPQGSDTIPIACRSAVPFNPFYPAGLVFFSVISPVCGPPDKSLFVSTQKEQPMSIESMSDDQILAIANPIMDNLMDASAAIDHTRHVKDFTDRAKNIVTPEHLRRVCEQYQREKGFFSRREPVAVFKRPGAVAIIWKQWFTKVSGEYVAEMLLVERDGRYLVDHVMVV
jgi:hypothetical protein